MTKDEISRDGNSGTAVAAEPVVRIADLKKVRAQADVSFTLDVERFEVASGQFAAVFGDSGCGKSTLLDMLGLILEPTSAGCFTLRDPKNGRVHDIGGLWQKGDQRGLARARATAMGYVLQTGGLLPFLTVEQNVALPLWHLGRPPDEDWLRELMNRMGIYEFRRRKPSGLSGGQRQRVAIVRALAPRPGLILADEPTAAVDKKRAAQIVEQFREVALQQGSAVVMVTHDQELIADISDLFFTFEVDMLSEQEIRSRCRMREKTRTTPPAPAETDPDGREDR